MNITKMNSFDTRTMQGNSVRLRIMFFIVLVIAMLARAEPNLELPGSLALNITGVGIKSQSPYDEFLERMKYKSSDDCKAIDDVIREMYDPHVEKLIENRFQGENVQKNVPCNVHYCIPKKYLEFTKRCIPVTYPDWRVSDGDFILGVEPQYDDEESLVACMCKVVRFQ